MNSRSLFLMHERSHLGILNYFVEVCLNIHWRKHTCIISKVKYHDDWENQAIQRYELKLTLVLYLLCFSIPKHFQCPFMYLSSCSICSCCFSSCMDWQVSFVHVYYHDLNWIILHPAFALIYMRDLNTQILTGCYATFTTSILKGTSSSQR